MPWGPATGLQELSLLVLKVRRKLARYLTLFWHKPKLISLGYKHNYKIPLHWWNYFFLQLKITYLSNQVHSLNIFVLSATQSSMSSNTSSTVFYWIQVFPCSPSFPTPHPNPVNRARDLTPFLTPACNVSFPVPNMDKALWLLLCVEPQTEDGLSCRKD